ncbi:hypothetical protein [Paenibacillus graminis]|nr:hypothetical protein [Paenibacillus graminis]
MTESLESLEALTDPLIRIRLEAMYRKLLDTDSNYKIAASGEQSSLSSA